MYLIVGLGNPQEKYKYTKHNAGFLVLDTFASKNGLAYEFDKSLNSLLCKTKINDLDVTLLKPQSGMNILGKHVAKALSYYKIPLANLFVVHDDVDLPSCTLKKAFNSGSAGHHGVEDIIESVGSKSFWRLRLGVGRPDSAKFDVENFVLSKFTKQEIDFLENIDLPSFFPLSI